VPTIRLCSLLHGLLFFDRKAAMATGGAIEVAPRRCVYLTRSPVPGLKRACPRSSSDFVGAVAVLAVGQHEAELPRVDV
jgi:hypothetical protein